MGQTVGKTGDYCLENSERNTMTYIGIDPGMSGGIAIIQGIPPNEHVDVIPMPETCQQVFQYLNPLVKPVTVCIEAVGSMPKQGVASTFKFGKGYGELLGICTALQFKIINPRPQAWKKVMLAGTDKSKAASIQRAEHLFPGVNLILPRCRKAHDGLAEALLLSEYGRRTSYER